MKIKKILNRYVKLKIKNGTIVNTYYGYILEEYPKYYNISLDGSVLKVDKDDTNVKLKLIDYPSTCDSYIKHEALHTTSLINDLISNSLLDHWYSISNPDFYKLIEEAQKLLYTAYSLVAEDHI